jgi:hypothetical protein
MGCNDDILSTEQGVIWRERFRVSDIQGSAGHFTCPGRRQSAVNATHPIEHQKYVLMYSPSSSTFKRAGVLTKSPRPMFTRIDEDFICASVVSFMIYRVDAVDGKDTNTTSDCAKNEANDEEELVE